jgi:excisionase family DNA binding protein
MEAPAKKILPLAERFGVTVATAAEYVGISKSRIYELLQNGELEGKVIRGRRIVVVQDLLRLCGEAPSTKRETARSEESTSP